MSRCYDCVYFIINSDESWCLMKQDYYIINGENVYPKKCLNFESKKGGSE